MAADKLRKNKKKKNDAESPKGLKLEKHSRKKTKKLFKHIATAQPGHAKPITAHGRPFPGNLPVQDWEPIFCLLTGQRLRDFMGEAQEG